MPNFANVTLSNTWEDLRTGLNAISRHLTLTTGVAANTINVETVHVKTQFIGPKLTANTLIINVSGTYKGTHNFNSGANVNFGNIANVHINGGTSGQLITTNGSGVLSFSSTLPVDSVVAATIATGAVGALEIANKVISNTHIANSAVDTLGLKDASVTTSKIAADAVTNTHIATSSIGAAELSIGAVTTDALSANSVTVEKMAPDVVTSDYTSTSYDINMLNKRHVTNVAISNNDFTLSVSNPPPTGTLGEFLLIWTQNATGGFNATWPASFNWPSNTAPTFNTNANVTNIIKGFTIDAGTKFHVAVFSANSAGA